MDSIIIMLFTLGGALYALSGALKEDIPTMICAGVYIGVSYLARIFRKMEDK